jgi:DNA polymerase-1
MNETYKKLLNEVEKDYQQLGKEKVLIVDGLNTFIRSWTVNPTMDDNGDHIGGIVGTLKGIGYAIREYNATRCIIVFDGKGGSKSRKDLYSGYKENRGNNRFRVNRAYSDLMNKEEEGVSMKRQMIGLIELLEYLPVEIMLYDSIEADDVMGYIASQLLKEDESAVIMSADKDFLQLVNERVKVYSPTKKKLYDTNLVISEYGVHPANFMVYRTLDGDKSDNIDGCGLKTIIKRFPEVVEEKEITIDDMFILCENRKSENKFYDKILDGKKIIERNYKLMQLSDPEIPTNKKLTINQKYLDNSAKLDKLGFIKKAMGMKVINSFGDVNSWIQTTFAKLHK